MDPSSNSHEASETSVQGCPACGESIDVTGLEPLATVGCPACGADVVIEGAVDWFALEAVAGRGGMGVVYRALDQRLGRHVAIKLLRPIHSGDAAQIALLETEAAITASISHPHVVKVFSTGVARGQFYIAMELVNKGSLDHLIRIQGRVAEAQVLEVAIQIASGLEAALNYGLIHRDIKPGNILFADAHTAKIVDFGLAIFMSTQQDVGGEIWGTPYYVAPEKLDQKPEDFRSDIYSLGATLFHALAGRPPFEAKDASQVALKHLKSKPPSLQAFAPDVSSRTAYIINRTLSKDPAERYQSYGELIEHLTYARDELRSGSVSTRHTQRVVLEDAQANKAWGLVVMALLAVTVAGLVAFFVFATRSNKAPEEPGLSGQQSRPTAPVVAPKQTTSAKPAPVEIPPAPKVPIALDPRAAPAETVLSKLPISGDGFGVWQTIWLQAGATSAQATWQAGVLQFQVAGNESGWAVDAMPLVYQKVSGNFELSAQITAVEGNQVGGRMILMARESLDCGAINVAIAMRTNLTTYHSIRSKTDTGTSPSQTLAEKLPVWLKLVRQGQEIEAFSSADRIRWKSYPKFKPNTLAAELIVGFGAVSGKVGKCTGTIEHIELKHLP